MLAFDLASTIVPVLSEPDTIGQALRRMVDCKVSHLPVLDETGYLGLICEKDIYEYAASNEPISSGKVKLLPISVVDNQHIYEIIDLISRYELTLLPVLTPEKKYLGSITLPILVSNFGKLAGVGEPGAILVLSIEMRDYSPAILSRILEDSQVKIINLFTISDPDSHNLTVTIKVNTQETGLIIRSLDRYGYTVKSSFMADSQLDDFYRGRFEEFMKYMNT